MSSHHFIGNGLVSGSLAEAVRDRDEFVDSMIGRVRDAGLDVVGHYAVDFDNDGLTLVWVLAESHLVLHYWGPEGYATLDLHVCDYRESNARKAKNLVDALTEFCFVAGSATWRELHLEAPTPVAVAAG